MKTKNVTFIKYHPLFAHDVGDEVSLTESDADNLLKSKHVHETAEKKASKEEDLKNAKK